MARAIDLLVVLALTALSGLLDARGFIFAAKAWPAGVLDWRIAAIAVLSFVGGLSCYVVAVKYMHNLGVTTVAIQTGLWFLVTGVAVALADNSILGWTRAQQLVGITIACMMCWLAVSTASSKL